ncbi:MAG: hypothetical protein Q4A56_06975 [Porphyromonadaceae bacterium]|nr:hypothetical protein [Porphyromonadaceae bacterium]
MKNSIYIQEIERLNSKISIYNLVDKHIKGKMIIAMMMSVLPYSLFFVFLFLKWYILTTIFFVIVLYSTYKAIYYIDNVRKNLIQQKYPHISQEGEFNYNRIFPEIQKQEVVNILGNNEILTEQKLLFIIESLKSQKEDKKYRYPIIQYTIGVFSSIIFGAFVPKILDYIPEMDFFNNILIPILILAPLTLIIIIAIEKTCKDLTLIKRQNQSRIIRTLENIYLDMYNK